MAYHTRPSPENAERIDADFQAFGFAELGLTAADFQPQNQVVQLVLPPNRIDLMTAIRGVSFDEAWRGRQFGKLDGVEVAFLNKDCLIRNKPASGREKDLEDLKRLA